MSTENKRRADRRNIAIIAHVDHGKTTLVDAMFAQTGITVKGEAPKKQVLDSNELEQERGITILAKCTAVQHGDVVVNIVDTPGHADFGSEVERVLRMVDGVLLVVDAVEGPMPQTKFVLRKALEAKLPPIVVVNKMDRPQGRPAAVVEEVSCLLIDLGADESQLEFPVLYAAAKQGWASENPDAPGTDVKPLLDAIVRHVPSPLADADAPLAMQVTMLDHSNYLGKIGLGRILRGKLNLGDAIARVRSDGSVSNHKVTRLMDFYGMGRREIEAAAAGDIVAVAGVEDVDVNDTLADVENPEGLPPLTIDEPTMSMQVHVNDSPFAGREGKFVTSRHIKNRLLTEAKTNVGLRVDELPGEGHFKISGRGELHLAVLIETMRREGFELSVSRPEVILKEIDGKVCEPVEALYLDIEEQYQGAVIENLGQRGGRLANMDREGPERVRLEYVVPARSLMGFKSEFMTMTRGTGTMYHAFSGYEPKAGDIPLRKNGVFIAKEPGATTAYALYNLQERATMLVGPGIEVYEGMIIGENSRDVDQIVNPCKAKHLSNVRSKASDEALDLTPHRKLTLEQAIEFIESDELVEVTPETIRLRKKILDAARRKRAEKTTALG